MHFGLVAFDLFAQMYREEIENAGRPGWPEEPPLEREEDIPTSILSNNIYGIDIDLRAVQLSALTLYLKTKSLNAQAVITDTKLVSANIQMGDEDKMKNFLNDVGLTRPIYKRILTTLSGRLRDSEQLGSLLRLEDEIATLIEKEREEYNKKGRQLDLFGQPTKAHEKEAVQLEFWDALESQIEQALHHFAKSIADNGRGQSFFVGETTKGLRLLQVISNQYDVVVTNPPYMSIRKMNKRLKNLVAKDYPESKGDLYGAFIKRCIEMTSDNGYIGMLTMHSFMFIKSYQNLRKWIFNRGAIKTLLHAGPALFAVGNPGTLQTAAYIIKRESIAEKRENSIGTYFRLIREPDSESKKRRFEKTMKDLKSAKDSALVYNYCQKDFDAIPGSPWVYEVSEKMKNTFKEFPLLNKIAKPASGQNTGNNFRFVRYWWEIGKGNLAFSVKKIEESATTRKKWFPYMKGGSFKRWYGNQEFCLNWHDNGKELKAFCVIRNDGKHWSRYLQNLDYNFKKGITYSFLTSSAFSARLSPGGFMFDYAGCSVFGKNIYFLLALLNSNLGYYFLKLINPTVNFQPGDIGRLPVANRQNNVLNEIVKEAIQIAKQDSMHSETTYDFILPINWSTHENAISNRTDRNIYLEKSVNKEIYHIYGLSAQDQALIEAELTEKKSGRETFSNGETSNLLLITVDLAYQWLSYAVGIVMGRFEPGVENGLGQGNFSIEVADQLRSLTDPDGILVMDEGHSDDLPAKVLECLIVILGESDAEDVIKTAAGKEGSAEEVLRTYLERIFFKEHTKQYRKRPVYWLLESPKKKYGVWLFHEKMNQDTLFRIRTEYVEPKINYLASQIVGLQRERDKAEGRKRRQIEKRIGEFTEILDDVQEFQKLLKYISEERGYRPHIDDGVLLNMAPLWELTPSWKTEPKKAWLALERGDYDWAFQAMDHWPERVKEKCKTNKSFAIAHGLDDK